MSDEKEAAVRRAAEALDNTSSSWTVFTAERLAFIALDASGVWQRIEELERELAEVERANERNVAWHMAAAKEARTLRADNERLRAELQQRDAEWGELAADNERLRELAQELLDAYVDACAQGTGEEPCSSPTWHLFMSTYEYADELIPRARAALASSPSETQENAE